MNERAVLAAKILLTLTAFEFFGPIVRDYNATHALNPAWVGHARLHLMWLLGFMFLSGVVNLWLIWRLQNLWLSLAWQACNLGGFWMAVVLAPVYGGAVTMPDTHVLILGHDENVVVFAVLSVLLLAAGASLRRAGNATGRRA